MKRNYQWILLMVITGSLPLISACGKGSAKATLQFNNSTDNKAALQAKIEEDPAAIMASDSPTAFHVKLIAAFLAEDIDSGASNVGNTSFIYLNKDCKEDVMHCDISGGTAEDGKKIDKIVTSYFDFNQSSAKVNAALNAQARAIEPGTYRYVRLEFCKYNHGNAKNVKWNHGTLAKEREFTRNHCTVTSKKMDPPLTINDGESVTITLDYDLSATVETGLAGAAGDDCEEIAVNNNTCFIMPNFVPSAKK